jgi:hypothetical protein
LNRDIKRDARIKTIIAKSNIKYLIADSHPLLNNYISSFTALYYQINLRLANIKNPMGINISLKIEAISHYESNKT